MQHAHAVDQGDALVLLGFVGDDNNLGRPFGAHRLRYLHHRMAFGTLADLLPAGHRDGIVVQDLVGDVHAGDDALSHGHHAAVEIGSVADVGEYMLFRTKGLLPNPGDALAAHLGEAHGAAVHPGRHEVATDTGGRARAFGHLGAGVVRAARAEPRRTFDALEASELEYLHRAFLGLQNRQVRVDAREHDAVDAHFLDPMRNGARDDRRRQVGTGAQQRVASRVRDRPFAARVVPLHLVELAINIRPHVGAPVVELLLELVFDDLALFLDHQDFLQPGGEPARQLCLQRPDDADLVQPNAQLAAARVVQPQIAQRLARVVIGLATGDDAKAIVRAFDCVVVQPVGADIGQRRVPLGVEQPRLLVQRMVRPAYVNACGWHHKVARHAALDPLRVDRRGGARLDNLLNRLHRGPHARKAAHRERMHAEVENLLHARRKEDRQSTGLEDMVALVGSGRALGHMVVAGDGDHTAPSRRARHIRVLEDIRAAVHSRTFAVPDAENAIKPIGSRWREAELLGSPQRGRRQLLVDAGLENNVLGLEVLGRLDQRLVVATQRRAAVTADETRRILAGQGVALALQHR